MGTLILLARLETEEFDRLRVAHPFMRKNLFAVTHVIPDGFVWQLTMRRGRYECRCSSNYLAEPWRGFLLQMIGSPKAPVHKYADALLQDEMASAA